MAGSVTGSVMSARPGSGVNVGVTVSPGGIGVVVGSADVCVNAGEGEAISGISEALV